MSDEINRSFVFPNEISEVVWYDIIGPLSEDEQQYFNQPPDELVLPSVTDEEKLCEE